MKSFSKAYQESLLHEKDWIMINGIFRKWPDSYIMKVTHSEETEEGKERGEGDRKTEKGKKGEGVGGVRRGQLTSRQVIKEMQSRRGLERKEKNQRTLGLKSLGQRDSETQLTYTFL